MAYRLDGGTAFRRAVYEAARQQLAESARDLQTLPDEEAVHALRKHCKKVRALLRLVGHNSRTLYSIENAHYRALANGLAASRDAVSLRDALASLSPIDAFPHIRGFLEARITATDEHALRDAAKMLAQGAARIEQWPLEALRWRDARRGYRRSYRRARKAMRRARAEGTAENFHEYRKRAKDQWYHTRLLEPKYHTALHHRRQPLKLLAQALGDLHDLQLLRRQLVLEGNPFHGELIPLLDVSAARLDELHRDIERLSRQLFSEKKIAFSSQ